MRIAICEDNKEMSDALRAFLSEHGRHSVQCFSSGDHLWFCYQDGARPFDLILLDIEMPGELNGLMAAQKIREAKDSVAIIILTAYKKYALRGYEVRPHSYLLKPVDFGLLAQRIAQVEEELVAVNGECLVLPVRGGLLRLHLDRILYLESDMHYTNIYTDDSIQPYRLYRKLTEVQEQCDQRFLTPHKSYIVNADRIQVIGNRYTEIVMDNGHMIPISKYKKKSFVTELTAYDMRFRRVRA